jgi:hypothetical protein
MFDFLKQKISKKAHDALQHAELEAQQAKIRQRVIA